VPLADKSGSAALTEATSSTVSPRLSNGMVARATYTASNSLTCLSTRGLPLSS
jgi:hypothetical protein